MDYTAEMAGSGEEVSEILECLNNLLRIRAGTQPADRDLGISWEVLDQIPEAAESLFVVELEEKVARYEPRAEVSEVTFTRSMEGRLTPHIVFQRKGGTG